MIISTAIRAGAHGNDPARLGHLVIDPAQRRRHLVAQCAGNDHDVRLAWAGAENHAETVEVVAAGTGVHHLDRATSKPEGHRP